MLNNLILKVYAQAVSIPLPANLATSTGAQAAQTLSDMSTYIYLVLGVILAAVLIEILIGALRK